MKYDKKELCLIWLDSFLGLEYKHKKELINLIEEKADIRILVGFLTVLSAHGIRRCQAVGNDGGPFVKVAAFSRILLPPN